MVGRRSVYRPMIGNPCGLYTICSIDLNKWYKDRTDFLSPEVWVCSYNSWLFKNCRPLYSKSLPTCPNQAVNERQQPVLKRLGCVTRIKTSSIHLHTRVANKNRMRTGSPSPPSTRVLLPQQTRTITTKLYNYPYK